MNMLSALLAAAAAATCVLARNTGPTAASEMSQLVPPRARAPAPLPPTRQYLNDFILPHLMMPRYLGYEESPQIFRARNSEHDWLNKEIDRINEMEDAEDSPNSYEMELSQWNPQESDISRLYEEPVGIQDMQNYLQERMRATSYNNMQYLPPGRDQFPEVTHKTEQNYRPVETVAQHEKKKKLFALTPLDRGYYEPEQKIKTQQSGGPHEGGQAMNTELEPPRQIRQNPNLSRGRPLVNDELERLRTKVTPGAVDNTKKSDNDVAKAQMVEPAADPADSIYGVALIAAVGSALAMIIVGFAFGWYTLSKKAKAAADVDYPAYGVTGPTIDMSGDRKLAHSAHMYHYQHQKQQIIAMERSGLDQGNGSVSDPESEEENEEGDYTVYECPGFATTGDIEVKNPLFTEDPTPATPGKCELVKPQPKE